MKRPKRTVVWDLERQRTVDELEATCLVVNKTKISLENYNKLHPFISQDLQEKLRPLIKDFDSEKQIPE